MADGNGALQREITRLDFLAADQFDRARRKAGKQRELKRTLDDACDALLRRAGELHGGYEVNDMASQNRDRIAIGESIAAFALKTAEAICALEPYGAKPERNALAGEMVEAWGDWPLDGAMSDGVVLAATRAELERLS